MMRVVLDTNTLASGALISSSSPASIILDAWRKSAFTLVVSDEVLRELTHTFTKPYFAARLTAQFVDDFIGLINGYAVRVEVHGAISGVATHGEDDRILETAITGGAAYLVTGDKEMQRLKQFMGIAIVTPRQFLDVLDREGGEDV